jgi:hypothetical protein
MQKMHTAVSYFYTHEIHLKSNQFSKKSNREWTENPTLLNIVARYIKSLYKQKVYFFFSVIPIFYLIFTINNTIL